MGYVIDKAKVHEIMKSNGINTQQELANKIGITKNQLSVVLSSKTTPFKSTYVKLCNTLNVSPFDIITKENVKDEIEKNDSKADSKLDEQYIDVSTVVPKRTYHAVEWFAGAGGLALGLEQAGFRELGLVEIDKFAAETLRTNRPSWNVIEDDIINIANEGISNYIVALV